MSEENTENATKSDSSTAPNFVDYHVLPDLNFNRHCFINDIYVPKKQQIYIYISCVKNPWLRNLNTDFTLGSCLFGSVKLTKNADPDKYKFRCYDIGFDTRSEFPFTDESIDNNNKGILILGEGPTQGLDDSTLTAKAKYLINFARSGERFVLSLDYN